MTLDRPVVDRRAAAAVPPAAAGAIDRPVLTPAEASPATVNGGRREAAAPAGPPNVLAPSLGGFTPTGGWITEGPEKIAPIAVWGLDTEPEPDEPHGGEKPPGPEPRRYPYPVIGNGLPDGDFPRAEVLWLAERLQRSEYERGQLKAENRRLLRRLRKLRHKGKR